MMAAQGLLPAPPKVMLPVLVSLSRDPDPKVAAAGAKALRDLPISLVRGALEPSTHPAILKGLSDVRPNEPELIELVLLHPRIDAQTLGALAQRVGEAHLTLIANNQQRLLEQPGLLEDIKLNPSATRSLVDKVESFLIISGVLNPEEVEVEFPPELLQEPEEVEAKAQLSKEPAPHLTPGQAAVAAHDAKVGEGDGEETNNLWALINDMGMGEKIKLATKGNATARSILIRSPNKLIALATINSPRMTDKEVYSIAQNRNVIEEVLRIISNNRQWMRRYDVKLALVNNPKCPVPISAKLVPHLRNNELKALSKNRNVPRVVAKKAKDLLSKRIK